MKIISLGVGLQSVALYYQSSMGQIPRADYAIFADPGGERSPTVDYLKFLQDWQIKNAGIPIVVRAVKNLERDLLEGVNIRGKRFASIPGFTLLDDGSVGMLRRQCTTDYKIAEVDKAIREILKLKPRQRFPEVEVWMGITGDEMDRASTPHTGWKTKVYPFLNLKFTKAGGAENLGGGFGLTGTNCISGMRITTFQHLRKAGVSFARISMMQGGHS